MSSNLRRSLMLMLVLSGGESGTRHPADTVEAKGFAPAPGRVRPPCPAGLVRKPDVALLSRKTVENATTATNVERWRSEPGQIAQRAEVVTNGHWRRSSRPFHTRDDAGFDTCRGPSSMLRSAAVSPSAQSTQISPCRSAWQKKRELTQGLRRCICATLNWGVS